MNAVTSKYLKPLLPVILVACSLLVAVLLFLSRPDTAIAPAKPVVALVDVAEVQLQDLRIPVQAQGTVMPHRQTTLISEVGGLITEASTAFNAGGFVAEGDVLVRIDDRDYQAALLRARAAVATAESTMAQEKGRAAVALREWQNLPKNAQRSQEAADLYLRKPQLEQAQAQLLSAQADLRKAQDDLDRTVIRAPYDCLVAEKRSDLGQFVSPGSPIAEVFSVDYAEVRLAVPQTKLEYLDLPGVSGFDAEDTPLVDIYTDVAGLVTHWVGRLHRTEAAIDERSRVLFAVARIDDPYGLRSQETQPLRIGTFVKANIIGREMSGLVVLPRYVLRTGNQLWVVDDQLKLRNRQVTTLRTGGDEIYVSSGLQTGDLVALTNLSGALPGMDVRINSRTTTLRQQQLMEAADTTVKPATTGGVEDTRDQSSDSATPDQSSSRDANNSASAV